MPRVTAHAVTSCVHCAVCTRRQAGHPKYVARQNLLMDVPLTQAEQYLSKITASHVSTLNTKIANQNVLKRILTALLNRNKADSNENLQRNP